MLWVPEIQKLRNPWSSPTSHPMQKSGSFPNRCSSNFYFDNSEEGGIIDFTKQAFWFWRAFIFWSKIKLKSNTLPIHLPSSVWSKQNAFTVHCLALRIFEASHHVPWKRFPGFLPHCVYAVLLWLQSSLLTCFWPPSFCQCLSWNLFCPEGRWLQLWADVCRELRLLLPSFWPLTAG